MQIGVDLAKSVFEMAVSRVPGRVQERRRLSRAALTTFFAAHPPAEVLLEACGSAHHWGRELQRLGHTVRLPGGDVRPHPARGLERPRPAPGGDYETGERGNGYVRMLLIHGVRSALRAGTVTRQPDDPPTWARAPAERKGHNVAAVALANKLARVCWRVWREQRPFARREPDIPDSAAKCPSGRRIARCRRPRPT